MKILSTPPGVTAGLANYPVSRHVDRMRAALIHVLSLRDFVFVLHDWGGIIGLRIVPEYPDRVAGVAISNTRLPEPDPDEPLPAGYRAPYPDPALTIGSRSSRACPAPRANRALLAWLTTNVGRSGHRARTAARRQPSRPPAPRPRPPG